MDVKSKSSFSNPFHSPVDCIVLYCIVIDESIR